MAVTRTASKRKSPVSEQSIVSTQSPVREITKNTFVEKFNTMNWTPIIVVVLIVGSFFLGMLVTKVQMLSSGTNNIPTNLGTGNTGAQPSGGPVVPLHVAKSIGMDVNKFNQCLDTGKYAQQVADDNTYAQKVGVQATPADFINGNLVLGAVPYTTLKQTIDQELQNPNAPLPTGTRVQLDNGPFPVMGDNNAPVTIVEFADFQCPFCEKFFSESLPNIISDYVKTGKVKMVFRNYAFLGPDSTTAAEGAYCAQEQGKFWDYYNFLYSHQGAEGSGQFSKTNLE